jgi:hypothetical protein
MTEEDYGTIIEDAKTFLNNKKEDFDVDTEYYTIVLLQHIEDLEDRLKVLHYIHTNRK